MALRQFRFEVLFTECELEVPDTATNEEIAQLFIDRLDPSIDITFDELTEEPE